MSKCCTIFTEERPNKTQIASLFHLIHLRLQRLSTLMSNQVKDLGALSISDRVGAARSCIHIFEALSNSVLSKLIITMCMSVLICSVREQLSWRISSSEPHFAFKTAVLERLIRKITTAVKEQISSATSLLRYQVLKIWALSCCGPDSGNQEQIVPLRSHL